VNQLAPGRGNGPTSWSGRFAMRRRGCFVEYEIG
jgi:hypothetical protein